MESIHRKFHNAKVTTENFSMKTRNNNKTEHMIFKKKFDLNFSVGYLYEG